MRFVHTADWQLGMTRHFLAGKPNRSIRPPAATQWPVSARWPRRPGPSSSWWPVTSSNTTSWRRRSSASRWKPCAPSEFPCTVTRQPRSARRVVGVHQRAVHRRMPGQRARARPARRPRGPAGPADRRGAVAVQGADDRPGCRRAGRPAGRRSHPGAGRARRCRRARPRPHQAVADPLGRRGRCAGPWGSALRGARRQAFVDRSG